MYSQSDCSICSRLTIVSTNSSHTCLSVIVVALINIFKFFIYDNIVSYIMDINNIAINNTAINNISYHTKHNVLTTDRIYPGGPGGPLRPSLPGFPLSPGAPRLP